MADRVAISNLALGRIGEPARLTDPYDDTKPGRAIRAVWDITRDTLLRQHPWNFAISRYALPAAADVKPAFGFGYVFPLPPGFIRLVEVGDRWVFDRNDYQLEAAGLVGQSAAAMMVRCVTRIEEVERWDPAFVDVFAWMLAEEVADGLTGDRSRKLDARAAAAEAISAAKRIDAIENPPEVPVEDDWIMARYS